MQQSFCFHSSTVDSIPFFNLGIHCPHLIQWINGTVAKKGRGKKKKKKGKRKKKDKRKKEKKLQTQPNKKPRQWCLTKVWGFLICLVFFSYGILGGGEGNVVPSFV